MVYTTTTTTTATILSMSVQCYKSLQSILTPPTYGFADPKSVKLAWAYPYPTTREFRTHYFVKTAINCLPEATR